MKRKSTSSVPSPTKKAKVEKVGTVKVLTTNSSGHFESNPISIVSWNVNGLRAAANKAGFKTFVAQQNIDIFCLNETKLQDSNIPENAAPFKHYPFRYWNWSQAKKGYSGVALFSKIEPISVRYGICIAKHDKEGRVITAEFDTFFVVSTYIPNAGTGGKLARVDYRTKQWDLDFRNYLKQLEAEGKDVIWLGDLNVIHKDIDIHTIKGKEKWAGCSPQERKQFGVTLSQGFVDTFRHLYPNKQQYSWFSQMNKTAKAKNQGWRLDYVVVSNGLVPRVEDSIIHSDVEGSDHVPIQLMLKNN